MSHARSALLAVMVAASAVAAVATSCSAGRETSETPTFDGQVAALLATRCVSCHGSGAPAGGWNASTYFSAIGCVAEGGAATLPTTDGAPLLRALDDKTHAGLVSRTERDALTVWVRGGAPKWRGTAHAASFVDPRSPDSHGRALRRQQWKPMLDPTDPGACGRCHDGSPTRPAEVAFGASGAPACTTCHREPGGALGCNTCHGQGAAVGPVKAYPPRDPCFFSEDARIPVAHAAHVESTATHATGIACASCHPTPPSEVIGGTHGNGQVEVRLDPAVAGAAASYDATSETCTTSCHARADGARPTPTWVDSTPMTCQDCHRSPPPGHLAGPCTSCHREADAKGTGFVLPAQLHINQRVDLGDGSGTCGACHGTGSDPWPRTGAHGKHAHPEAAAAAPCESCHRVPTEFGAGTSHPHGGDAVVILGGRAAAGGSSPTYTAGSCQQVYCHGAGLEGTTAATPVWSDTSGTSGACGACHTLPPGAPHPTSNTCSLCHRDATTLAGLPAIATNWASLHVNGEVDRGGN